MFEIRRALSSDVEAAAALLGEAFADDPLMAFFFRDDPKGIRRASAAFFALPLEARIALDMPVHVLLHGGAIGGVVMGYDTRRPRWPEPIAAAWQRFETGVPGFAARLAAYEALCDKHEPPEPHYYLGVIGVAPALQGRGAGRALLDHFCALSEADPRSHCVYLDTTNPASLRFYQRNGFEPCGEGDLEGMPLWCVYRRT